MIIGLGSDIVNIERIAELLEKQGNKFKSKYFTTNEIGSSEKYSSDNKNAIYGHFAKRFAAKEAFAKAVGTGFGKHLSFIDVGIINEDSGKPLLVLSKKANALVADIAKEKSFFCHVSLSDDYPYALAVVIIEIYDTTQGE